MKFTFLSASMALTKTYTKTAAGIEKTAYPHAYEFTSVEENPKTLNDLLVVLQAHAAKGHCLLKGNVQAPLISESRAGSTLSQDTTEWICLDLDGLPGVATVEDFMHLINLGNVSYIVQWSASYGIFNNHLRCHIYVLLDKPVPAPLIKQWLIHLNHTVTQLRDAQALTKTGNAILWPLDITASQNDKLIYIAPPILKGVKNPLGKTPRISLVKKTNAKFTFPGAIATTANRALTDKRIGELRAAAGLPARKLNYKVVSGTEVLVKPDSCDVTEMKQERGFVYFNINGGDSWAYYHPENNPDYIHNFKGEPVYLTKELLPDYWASLQQSGHRVDSSGLTYLAFCDRKTGLYWKGSYDTKNDVLDITVAKSLVILQHFAKQYGLVIGDFVPEWDMHFDPHDSVRVDFDNRTINTFQLTEYMKAVAKPVKICPPTILKVIHHALGGDADITEHFMNWVAFILQKRTRTLTSWVLHGTEGTGKGILMNTILRPLFGMSQTTVQRMEQFKQPYNDYLKQCFLVFIDEVQTSQLLDEQGVAANIRNYISEPTITIRHMYATPTEYPNFTNWIFFSNKPDPVQVPRGDRRTNVAKYQPNKFYPTDKDLTRWATDKAKIERELQAFHDYLLHFQVDEGAAGTVIQTEDRETLISISENAIDTVANALIEGSMEFFIDQLPTNSAKYLNNLQQKRLDDYKDVLFHILTRTDALTGRVNIPRDELRDLFEYTIGKMPESPNKFTALLKHHRIYTKRVWSGEKTVHGISTTFKDVQKFDAYLTAHFKPKPNVVAKPKAKTQ